MNYQYKNSIGEVRTATGFVLLKLDSAVKFWKIADNVRRLQIYQMVALDLMVLEEYGGLLIQLTFPFPIQFNMLHFNYINRIGVYV